MAPSKRGKSRCCIIWFSCDGHGTRTDHDTPGKDALEGYFPDVHRGIDWSCGHRFFDNEFHLLLWQIEKKLGADAISSVRRIAAADNDTLRLWSERILTADTVDAIFH